MDEYELNKLLTKINELEAELKTAKKYGLVWNRDKNIELTREKCKTSIPFLVEDIGKKIINGKTNNLLLEGDNFYSLVSLNYIYKNSIDMIYIDPPYNTGHEDFIYNDKYVDEEDGYRHSKWLNFMKCRLLLAKDLLKDSGFIFISIDDNEQANLRLLCDSIFGEHNFIMMFPRVTVKGGKLQTAYTTSNCDWLICYAKKKGLSSFRKQEIEDDPAFKYSDEYVDIRGRYHTKQALDTVSLGYIASLYWDTEKKRYPMYDHCAVIVAEEITGRFMNVIQLFNGSIPLIAIQLSAYKVGDDISLHFTKVLDRVTLGTVEEDEYEVTDRKYWELRSTPTMMKFVDTLFELLKDFTDGFTLKYNKFYIGVAKNGIARNFITFTPKKNFIYLDIACERSESIERELDTVGLSYAYKRWNEYQVRLNNEDDFKKGENQIRKLVELAFSQYNL